MLLTKYGYGRNDIILIPIGYFLSAAPRMLWYPLLLIHYNLNLTLLLKYYKYKLEFNYKYNNNNKYIISKNKI